MKEDLATKLEVLQGSLGIKKVLRIGNSYAVVLPKEWVEFFCLRANNNYWAIIEPGDNNSVVLRPLVEQDIEGIEVSAKK